MASSSYDLYTVLGLLSKVIAPVNKILTTQIQQQTFSNPSHLFPPSCWVLCEAMAEQ